MICIDVYVKRESETCYFSTCILHLSLLTIPWTEEPGWLQSSGLEESDTTEHTRTHSIPAECMTLDCALNLNVYLTKQYSGKVGQEESTSKSWSKVKQKWNFCPETKKANHTSSGSQAPFMRMGLLKKKKERSSQGGGLLSFQKSWMAHTNKLEIQWNNLGTKLCDYEYSCHFDVSENPWGKTLDRIEFFPVMIFLPNFPLFIYNNNQDVI